MIPVVLPRSKAIISRSKEAPASGDDESGLPGRTFLHSQALQLDKQDKRRALYPDSAQVVLFVLPKGPQRALTMNVYI